MEKITPDYTIRTEEDIKRLKENYEKNSIKISITVLLVLLTPIAASIVWKIFFGVDPIDRLLSQKYGMLIYIICGLLVLKALTWTKISKEAARLHLMVRGVKKYEALIVKLEKSLERKDELAVQEILNNLQEGEELFGRLEEYKKAVTKAKEFLELQQ